MLGGFSSKNPSTSFAPRFAPALPRTRTEWTGLLVEVKRLYLRRQYKQCATQARALLKTAKTPVYSYFRVFQHSSPIDEACYRSIQSTASSSISTPQYPTSFSVKQLICTRVQRSLSLTRRWIASSNVLPLSRSHYLYRNYPRSRSLPYLQVRFYNIFRHLARRDGI